MTAKTLYKTTISTEGALNERVGAYDGVVPYFVSGPLHRDVGIVGALGATLHVSSWIIALVMDILILGRLSPDKTSDEVHYDYWLATFIPLVVGLGVVVIATLLHAFTTMKVPEGGMPPFLMTLMTGGAILCVIFTYILMTWNSTGLNKYTELSTKYTDPSELAKKQAAWVKELRRFGLWSLLAKVYIWQFVYNNQLWAASDPKYRPS